MFSLLFHNSHLLTNNVQHDDEGVNASRVSRLEPYLGLLCELVEVLLIGTTPGYTVLLLFLDMLLLHVENKV